MQRVDPFIPVAQQPRLQSQAKPMTSIRPRAVHPQSVRAMDGFAPRQPAAQPIGQGTEQQHVGVAPAQQPRPNPPAQPEPQPQTSKPKKPRRILHLVQLPLFLLTIIAAGLLVQSAIVGEVALVAYAIFAIVRRVPSRTTFLLALLSLVAIVVLLVIKPSNALAANFAVYTFLLLVAGVITLGRETRTRDI